jgi:hypothetical protein
MSQTAPSKSFSTSPIRITDFKEVIADVLKVKPPGKQQKKTALIPNAGDRCVRV